MRDVDLEQSDAVRALGHPVRLRILGHLWRHGASTVTEIARAEDLSTASVSYHAHRLAKARFIERADELVQGKEKPWRTVSESYTASHGRSDRESLSALRHAVVADDSRRVQGVISDWDTLAEDWQRASFFASRGFFLSSSELSRVVQVLLETLSPFESRSRDDKPEDAVPVRLMLYGFPEIDRPGINVDPASQPAGDHDESGP